MIAPDDPLAAGSPRLADFARHRWAVPVDTDLGRLTVAACHNAGFEPDIMADIEDPVALLGLAASGLAVALLPDLVPSRLTTEITRAAADLLSCPGGTMSAVRVRQGLPWLITVLLAIGVLALVTAWVSADGINRGEALKTGGLAAGSVVALYALWLNDRRRRTEEQRQEIERRRQELETERYALEQRRQDLEHQRAQHDRERVADERFARAVELLGNSADQVRVGAMHALAGLARSRPSYTQTVLDVLCSYLRRPFDHPAFFVARGGELKPEAEEEEYRKKREEADRWLQVRQTAQRLIAELLPPASDVDAPGYDLDLTGATLEYFDISGRAVRQILARRANLYQSNFKGTVVRGPTWFTEAKCWGRLHAPEIVFHERCFFSRIEAHGVVDFTSAEFHGPAKFADAVCHGPVSFRDAAFRMIDLSKAHFRGPLDLRVAGDPSAHTEGMTVSLEHEVQLPDGWVVDRTRGTSFGLVRNPASGVT